MLNIVAKHIYGDYETLSCKLGINISGWEHVLAVNKSCEECLHLSFDKLRYQILWKDLKENLIQMDRKDIIVLAERENSVTLGKETKSIIKL